MASKSDMKGFYRQTKKSGGITKPTHSKSSLAATTTKKSVTPKLAAARGSNNTRSPALISHGSPDLQAAESYVSGDSICSTKREAKKKLSEETGC